MARSVETTRVCGKQALGIVPKDFLRQSGERWSAKTQDFFRQLADDQACQNFCAISQSLPKGRLGLGCDDPTPSSAAVVREFRHAELLFGGAA